MFLKHMNMEELPLFHVEFVLRTICQKIEELIEAEIGHVVSININEATFGDEKAMLQSYYSQERRAQSFQNYYKQLKKEEMETRSKFLKRFNIEQELRESIEFQNEQLDLDEQ